MTNTKKLKAAFVFNGLTQQDVATKMGISVYTLAKKLHNKTEFKASEISFLENLLKLQDIHSYFFKHAVDK